MSHDKDYPIALLAVEQIAAVIHPDAGWLPLQVCASLLENINGMMFHDDVDDFMKALAAHFAKLAAEKKAAATARLADKAAPRASVREDGSPWRLRSDVVAGLTQAHAEGEHCNGPARGCPICERGGA